MQFNAKQNAIFCNDILYKIFSIKYLGSIFDSIYQLNIASGKWTCSLPKLWNLKLSTSKHLTPKYPTWKYLQSLTTTKSTSQQSFHLWKIKFCSCFQYKKLSTCSWCSSSSCSDDEHHLLGKKFKLNEFR